MREEAELQIEGDDTLPTLIYLPGVHGDWTLIRKLSRCLAGKVRFVSVTYPRTLTWSLEDYAAAVEKALHDRNIHTGWLLAESFSSQVVWLIIARAKLTVTGVILAGGFVKHPLRWIVRPASVLCRRSVLRPFFPLYLAYATFVRWKSRDNPGTGENIGAFMARRTDLDLQAMRHRLRLIARNDPRHLARQTTVPVFGLTGLIDPIVPWPWVRHWLRRHCPALRDYQVIAGADHNVLNMAAKPSAKKILEWMEV